MKNEGRRKYDKKRKCASTPFTNILMVFTPSHNCCHPPVCVLTCAVKWGWAWKILVCVGKWVMEISNVVVFKVDAVSESFYILFPVPFKVQRNHLSARALIPLPLISVAISCVMVN